MKTVKINILENLKNNSSNLDGIITKDLQNNEEICPICNGLGLIIQNNVYGLGEKDKSPFPYKKQSMGYCQNCYNGVVKKCDFCGKLLTLREYECDCEGFKNHKIKEEIAKNKEKYDRAKKGKIRGL